MSRLAKYPIDIPAGLTVAVNGNTLSVKGPKGELIKIIRNDIINIVVDGATVQVSTTKTGLFPKSLLGTYASHIRNMINGVTSGYEKKLELHGVGYRVAEKGNNLEFQLGFSHPVIITKPNDLTVTVEKNTITVFGIDKERVGWFSALLRSQKKPEPYKGKGIKYAEEVINRKQGKKSA